MTLEEYQALVYFVRASTHAEKKRQIESMLRQVEERNGVTRHVLVVQWQETGQALPPNTRFPDVWPPQLRVVIERTDRPLSRADVTKVLETRAVRPLNIMVTTDPAGELGWTAIDEYFTG
jgi:hypothetical protein